MLVLIQRAGKGWIAIPHEGRRGVDLFAGDWRTVRASVLALTRGGLARCSSLDSERLSPLQPIASTRIDAQIHGTLIEHAPDGGGR